MIDPYETTEYAKAFNNICGIFRFFKQFIENSIRKHMPGQRTIKLNLTTELKEAISSGDLVYGDKVKIDGYLSKYAHMVLPASFIDSVYDTRRAQKLKERRPNDTLLGVWKAAQIPISSLRPLSTKEGVLSCAFLYSKYFTGFLYNQPVDPEDKLRGVRVSNPPNYAPRVRIPEYSRPIPVIFYDNKYSSLLDHYVEIEARVQPIPKEFMPDLHIIYNTHFDRGMLSLFFDLSSDNLISYCLSLCDPDTGVKQRYKKTLTNRLVLYAEGHVQADTVDDNLVTVIHESIPLHKAPALHFSVGEEQGNVHPVMFVPDDELFAFYKPPLSVGFYVQTSDQFPFALQHKRLSEHYTLFKTNIEEHFKSLDQNSRPQFKLDFLYDFSRAWDFDSAGVLDSKVAYDVIKGDQSLQDTRNWLRGSQLETH